MNAPGNAGVPAGINKNRAEENTGSAGANMKVADGGVGDGKNADGDVGAPGRPRGWYSRGYLPHCDAPELIQFVTYRLADSLPQSKLVQLREELRRLPEKQRKIETRKRIEKWLDAGMGCRALAHPDVARYVQNSFLHFHGKRYRLHAWCIMPNHVHVLLEPLMDLAAIVQGWKSYTARWILGKNRELGLNIPSPDQLWMREYWDRYIRNDAHYESAVEYIHQNPVKAGLCDAAEAWPWSSAFSGDVGDLKSAGGNASDGMNAPGNAGVPAGINKNRAEENTGSAGANVKNADGDVGAPGSVT
jgi:type I restriction enzyme R subunit/putative DNA methylase